MFRPFEEFTQDIGGELKRLAEEKYNGGRVITIFLTVGPTIAGLFWAGSEENIICFFCGLASGIISALVWITVKCWWAIHLYAKGEMIHQLTRQTELLQKGQLSVQDQSKTE